MTTIDLIFNINLSIRNEIAGQGISYYFLPYLGILLLIILRLKLYKTHMVSAIIISVFFVTAILRPYINPDYFIYFHSFIVLFIFGSSLFIYYLDENYSKDKKSFRYHNILKTIPISIALIYMIIHMIKFTAIINDAVDFFTVHMVLATTFVSYITFYPIFTFYLDRKDKDKENEIKYTKNSTKK